MRDKGEEEWVSEERGREREGGVGEGEEDWFVKGVEELQWRYWRVSLFGLLFF